MASYNPNNRDSLLGQSGFVSRQLRRLSSWGTDYNDLVDKNKKTIGVNEDPNDPRANMGDMYDIMSSRAIANLLSTKSVANLDRAYPEKRRILREYSMKDDIREYITTIADEIVIYDTKKYFAKPMDLPDKTEQDIKDAYSKVYNKIYRSYGFNDGIRATHMAKKLLVDGYLAFEIVWDDRQRNIIGFREIDAVTLIPAYDPLDGTNIWVQNPENPSTRRIVLDVDIIYISYKTQDSYSETSYVEPLIRPYNQYQLIVSTRLMFNMANASVYQKFTIPVKDLPEHRAKEAVSKMIANYSENVTWDDTMGTVEINGSKNLPYNKQIWFPEGDSGTPDFELISPDGHNLNESDMLEWFYKALKRASKIPFSRFDQDTGGGSLFSDADDMTRDEIKFSNFIDRLRSIFKELLTKPLRLQMLRDYPELMEDDDFINSIGIEFNSNDLFEEWKELRNLEKRAGILSTLLNEIEINNKPYFHPEFLVSKIMKLTEEERQENQRFWKTKPIGEVDAQEAEFDLGADDMGDLDTDADLGDLGDLGGDDEPDEPDTDFEF